MRRSKPRGFTMVEIGVTLAILAVLAVIAYDRMSRARPRATLKATGAELQSLVHQARQEALASGVNVWVLVFPTYTERNITGRIVVVKDSTDPAASLGQASAVVNLVNYAPATPRAPAGGRVIATFDLPPNVQVGPLTGPGSAFPFPFTTIPTGSDCAFCQASSDRRGALFFDGSGRSHFRRPNGTAVEDLDGTLVNGGSLTLFGTQLRSGAVRGTCTLMVTRPQGLVRIFQNG